MISEKPSTKTIRIILSIRDSLDQIENGKSSSFAETNRLENLNRIFTNTLFHQLLNEIDLWKTYQPVIDFPPKS